MAMSFRDFPEGVLMEIFLRLPVKSLLECKSVCNPWLSIISNPHFIKSHLHLTISSHWNNPTLLTILNHTPSEVTPSLVAITPHQLLQQQPTQLMGEEPLDTHGQDLSNSPVSFDRLVMPSLFGYGCQVIGSFNGIICLTNFFCNDVYLWNPTIRKCRKLPAPLEHTTRLCPLKIGFGYDSDSNEYKVLVLLYDVIPLVEVYSTGTDCWKEFKAPILKNWKNSSGAQIVVNGVLYLDGEEELVSFDLRNEVLGRVPFPTLSQNKKSEVLDFEGCVAMVFKSGSGTKLWTLDDVSGQLSWNESFSIENDSESELWLESYLGAGQFYGRILQNGSISMYRVLYDYEKKEFKYHEAEEQNFLANLKYTKTFVSLDGFE